MLRILNILKLFLIIIVITNLLNQTNSFFIENDDQYRLVLVQFIFRHGDRTPIRLYGTDPYKRSDFVEGLGQLTNRGKNRMFRLGETLKRRYENYLSIFSTIGKKILFYLFE